MGGIGTYKLSEHEFSQIKGYYEDGNVKALEDLILYKGNDRYQIESLCSVRYFLDNIEENETVGAINAEAVSCRYIAFASKGDIRNIEKYNNKDVNKIIEVADMLFKKSEVKLARKLYKQAIKFDPHNKDLYDKIKNSI